MFLKYFNKFDKIVSKDTLDAYEVLQVKMSEFEKQKEDQGNDDRRNKKAPKKAQPNTSVA